LIDSKGFISMVHFVNQCIGNICYAPISGYLCLFKMRDVTNFMQLFQCQAVGQEY